MNTLEKIVTDERIDAAIDAGIIFAISMITELIAIPGMPDVLALYHSGLVSGLAFFIFYAKKRGVNNFKAERTTTQ